MTEEELKRIKTLNERFGRPTYGQVKKLLSEIERLKADNKDAMDLLRRIDQERWFQPGPDRGVCNDCDGGQEPGFENKHDETRCFWEIVHRFLVTKGGRP